MKVLTPKQVQQQAKKQAKKILTTARTQAILIRQQAIVQAKNIRERELKRRAKNKERAEIITRRTNEFTKKAVDVVRINTPNTLTLFNGVSGFISIIAAVEQKFFTASAFILIGVFFDWIDGKVARTLKQETALGKELDSLSDLITFGVAPAVLVAMIQPSFFSYFAGALFVLSAALRLGKFNVQETKGVYFGIPTTTNGILLPLFVYGGLLPELFPWYLLVMAFMMNAPIELKKLF